MHIYLDALRHILKHGEQHDDRTGVGTVSVFGYQMRFDLREGFPLLTTKKMPFRWIAEELFWFLRGSTDERELRAVGVDIWKEWATEQQCAKFNRLEGDLGPIYGFLWRHFGGNYIKSSEQIYDGIRGEEKGADQIARLLRDISASPNSRRLIVSGWDPEQCDNVALPPCHTLFQFKVHRDDSLSCHLYARSIDAFLGLPFNIASYALLTELIAKVTGRQARDLIISFGDLHIYKNHLEAVETQLSRVPGTLPLLRIENEPIGLDGLLSVTIKDLVLVNYFFQPKIAAVVAV